MYWKTARFEFLYEIYCRRITIEELNQARRSQINAILANGGYLESNEALAARTTELAEVNAQYDELINGVNFPRHALDTAAELAALPVMAAGIRALDNARWEFEGAMQVREMIG